MSSPRKKLFKSSPRHIHFPHFFSKNHHKSKADKESTLADSHSLTDETSRTEIMEKDAVRRSNSTPDKYIGAGDRARSRSVPNKPDSTIVHNALWVSGDTPRMQVVGGSITGQKGSPTLKDSPTPKSSPRTKWIEMNENLPFEEPSSALSSSENDLPSSSTSVTVDEFGHPLADLPASDSIEKLVRPGKGLSSSDSMFATSSTATTLPWFLKDDSAAKSDHISQPDTARELNQWIKEKIDKDEAVFSFNDFKLFSKNNPGHPLALKMKELEASANQPAKPQKGSTLMSSSSF